jgi:cell division protein FtsN
MVYHGMCDKARADGFCANAGLVSNTASAHVSKPLSSQASAGIAIAVLAVVLAIISAIVFSVKRRTHRKSEVLDSWIKALEEKQAEAKEMGSAPAVIEGVTMAPPQVMEGQQKRESRPGLDEEMLNEMRKGPYGSVHRAQRIQRGVRFSVHADHGPP